MTPATLLPPPEPRAEAPMKIRADWLALALVAIGLALRLNHLGTGLWFDEIQTFIDYVRRPLGAILTTYDNQNQHLLYSVLARITTGMFGDSPGSLRLPAALLGAGSLWATYRFARPLVGERHALLGTALLTVSYHHIWFSQNARGYTGLLLFTLIGTGALIRLLTLPATRGTIATYAVAMALAAYTHFTAVFVSIAHALVILALWVRARRHGLAPVRGPLVALVGSGLVAIALYGPVLSQLLHTLVGPNPYAADTAWQSPTWLVTETIRGLGAGVPGGWPVLLVGVAVFAAGIIALGRRSWVLPIALLLPALLTALVVLGLGHNLWPRFFFFSAGFFVLIAIEGGFAVARAVVPAWGERLGQAGLLAMIGLSCLTVSRAWLPKQDYQGAAGFVDSHAGPNDAVAVVDLTDLPYRRYYQRPWTAVDSEAALESIEQSHDKTWLLYTFPIRLQSVQPAMWARLAARYDTAAVYPGTVGGGAVVIMVSRTRSPTT